ncbi:MAG: hypothetical protein KGI80_06395 [Verrucomicrobiota bacterium]|nr:hypothetical protein [Verrucomicrobiota bacterium]
MRRISAQTLLILLFLAISLISSFAVLYLSVSASYEAVQTLDTALAKSAGENLSSNMTALFEKCELFTRIGATLAEHSPNMAEDQLLASYFLEQLTSNPFVTSYRAATSNGSYLICLNLANLPDSTFSHAPPPDAFFALITSDGNGKATTTYYTQGARKISSREEATSYNPRNSPWYNEALRQKKLIWTEFYKDQLTSLEEISAAIPTYAPLENLSIVISTELSADTLVHYLKESTFSKHGAALIINEKGETILPHLPEDLELGKTLFATFQQENKNSFFFSFNHLVYLGRIEPFPASFTKNWHLAAALARSDFFSGIVKNTVHVMHWISLVLFSTALIAIYCAYAISEPILKLAKELMRLSTLELQEDEPNPSILKEIQQMQHALSATRVALRSFSRYIPQDVAKELMKKEHDITLGGEQKTLTIFFTDIANFTTLADTLPIEMVNDLLAKHFDLISQVIIECGGMIDKYIGDSIMSLWGALRLEPIDISALQACKAALLSQLLLKEWNQKQKAAGFVTYATRMGISTGSVIVGNFGTETRMNFSVLGNAANSASRLQELNKTYGTSILIGEDTHRVVGSHVITRCLGTVTLRGTEERCRIFELLAIKDADSLIAPASSQLVEWAQKYTEAVIAKETGDRDLALKIFTSLAQESPEDLPTQLQLKSLQKP